MTQGLYKGRESILLSPISKDNSMGFVRYVLAGAVLVAHFNELFGANIKFPISSYNAVGAFFALSGFLVYPSYLKHNNLRSYIAKRARRLLPPYLFIVFLCAFGLVTVSTLPAQQYFFTQEWARYFGSNIIFLNFLGPDLPGVFLASPISAVNGSLWTMKVEVMLYLSVPLVATIVALCRRRWMSIRPEWLFIVIYLLSVVYRFVFMALYDATGNEIYNMLSRQFFGQLMYFYSGVMIYFNYEILRKHSFLLLSVGIILVWALGYSKVFEVVMGPFIVALITLSGSFFTGWLKSLNANNVSYGIYLFHFPILQLMRQYGGALSLGLQFVLSLLSVTALSCFSWFMIEKRFLTKRYV